MKIADLRQKTKTELERFLQEGRERLRVLQFDLVAGKVKNVREVRQIKKDIAKTLTLLKEKEKI
jgi:large subunit ribosomal protein L29